MFSIMLGTGEQVLPAFVLALGMGELASGLIATVPLLIGALLQLLTPRGVNYVRSHRRWVYRMSYLQAAVFLPLILGAYLGSMPLLAVFGLASAYYAFNFTVGPPWNVWMEQLIPVSIRARFFARRTRFTQGALLLGFVLAGSILQWSDTIGRPVWIFAVLFGIAFVARMISASYLANQSEPATLKGRITVLPWRTVWANALTGRPGRLLVYLWLVQGAAQVSGPFFTPYMLEQLDFAYGTYVAALAVSFAAKAISAPLWGRVAHRYGARTLLIVGGIAVIPMSALWLLTTNAYGLFLIQVFAGIGWAAYELGFFLMFFENIRPQERMGVLSVYNLGFAAATVVGSLIGGACLIIGGRNPAAYLTLFALSSILRLGALPFAFRIPKKAAKPTDVIVVLSAADPIGPLERAA